MSTMTATHTQERTVRMAARAIGRAGLAHAYGHCSLRLDAEHFLVCAPKPMGMVTPQDSGTIVTVHGALPDGVLGEVRIHQQIYRRRAEVGGIIRSMPRDVMALSTAGITPQARHGMGTYSPAAPLWNDPQLVRTEEQASAVADLMGQHNAVVMRGNGAVVASTSLEHALVHTWYLEDAARIELDIRRAGLLEQGIVLSEEECRQRAVGTGMIYERMWDYLTAGDPESSQP